MWVRRVLVVATLGLTTVLGIVPITSSASAKPIAVEHWCC
jgi:hypothetical protein